MGNEIELPVIGNRMLRKGLAKATLQVRLTALAYNLKRTMTIKTVVGV